MNNFILKMKESKIKIHFLSEYLTDKEIEHDLNNNIQITLSDELKLSICVPLDALEYFETMLKKNGDSFYDNECNYEDICRFITHEEVYEEILRVQDYIDEQNVEDVILLKAK